jgi:hypothetical protein
VVERARVPQFHEISLAEQVRRWKDDERENIKLEQENALKANRFVVGDGEVPHRDHLRAGDLDQVMCERPSGSSHVVDGGGAAQRLIGMARCEEADPGRGLRKLVESRPYLEVDCQSAVNF